MEKFRRKLQFVSSAVEYILIKSNICHLFYAASKDSQKLVHVKGSICNSRDVSEACKNVDAVIHSCSKVAVNAFPDKDLARAVNVTGKLLVQFG